MNWEEILVWERNKAMDKKSNDAANDALTDALTILESYRLYISELEQALLPFSQVAIYFSELGQSIGFSVSGLTIWQGRSGSIEGSEAPSITFAHVRAAHDVLEKGKKI